MDFVLKNAVLFATHVVCFKVQKSCIIVTKTSELHDSQ